MFYRQGKMCRRCLRGFDDDTLTIPDYESSIACTEDGDDASLNELLMHRTNSVQNMMYDSAVAAAAAAAAAVSTATPPPPPSSASSSTHPANQVITKVLLKVTEFFNQIYLTIPTNKPYQPFTRLPMFLFSAFIQNKNK